MSVSVSVSVSVCVSVSVSVSVSVCVCVCVCARVCAFVRMHLCGYGRVWTCDCTWLSLDLGVLVYV